MTDAGTPVALTRRRREPRLASRLPGRYLDPDGNPIELYGPGVMLHSGTLVMEVDMPFKALLTIAGLLGLAFGVAFFLAPAATLGLYGASTGDVGYLMTRLAGAALFHLGLVYLMIRDVQDPVTIRRLSIASALGSLAGLRVALYGVRNDLVNAVGWSSVAIYALLVLGFAWFAYRPAPPAR